ncbi:hypothetical protein MNBD_GAMMA26-1898 [hydrothermal vent metagenome]|uniref:Aminotransferase, DegT/DnrJ/EryC1/StrS family n=1 Tax=hydrothermal vent metagenome TaxID=652676 RepID=A0A3B1ATT3_9ZZZZ
MSSIKDQLKQLGGKGCFSKILSTSNLYLPSIERVLKYLKNHKPSSSNHNPLSRMLEERLCEYHKTNNCVLFSSGFWALVSAIKLKSIEGRQNVIIPSMTYRRLADVVHWSGNTPVFVDVNKRDLAVSVDAVRKSIDSETALILAVHPIVNCCDIQSFIDLSHEVNIPLIFDAVESVHETFDGKRIGSFGCGEVFSFHASKLINGIEGGYVCTNDNEFAAELKQLVSFGVGKKGSEMIVGMDARPIDGHAAFALAGLDEIEINISHNNEIYATYKHGLREIEGLNLMEFDETEQTSFKNIVVEVTEKYPISRDSLVAFLNSEGLLARSHYDPPLHRKEYAYNVITKDMINSNQLCSRYINLPCGAIVLISDVEKILKILKFISVNSHLLEVE